MMTTDFGKYPFLICSILLGLSAALYISDMPFIPYVYAVSGAGVAVAFLTNIYRGDNARLRRLNIQQAVAALLLPVSSYFMFKNMNEWFICLLVSGILQIYIIFVRNYEKNKDNKE
ncbi:MAG: hypothetical protein LBH12_01300 [Dysgonamonadaceae bacterium]|jgi:hypothetical protein|nr:hypothetical protein [Dysgonamonadaceae bacterium]